MFKKGMLALIVAGLIYAVPAVVAQDAGSNEQQSAPAGAPPEHGGHGRMDPQQRSEMLAKHLNLNADQQAKVLDIMKSEQSQMEKVHSDSSMAPQDQRAKMMDIHKTSSDQIRALLDPTQQKKFDEMQSRREQWQGGGHHGHGQAPGAAPDSDQK